MLFVCETFSNHFTRKKKGQDSIQVTILLKQHDMCLNGAVAKIILQWKVSYQYILRNKHRSFS